jgi:hypothetical protein
MKIIGAQRSRSPSAKGCHSTTQKRKKCQNSVDNKSPGLLHPVHWVVRCDILAIMVGIFLIAGS